MRRTGLPLVAIALLLLACSESEPERRRGSSEDDVVVAPRELDWRAPHGWKSAPTSSAFMRARYRIASSVGGDTLELTIAHQAGGLGGVEANLARWISQFRRSDGTATTSGDATIVRWPRAGAGVELMTISLSGTYVGGMDSDAPERSDQRLSGAVARLEDDSLWFLKCVGPRLEVEARLSEIEALWSSLRSVPQGTREEAEAVNGKTRLAFNVPDGWRPVAIPEGSSMRYAAFEVADPSGGKAISVVLYHTASGMGSVESNVARWAGQMKSADGNPLTASDAIVAERRIGEFETTTVDVSGTASGLGGTDAPDSRMLGVIARGPDGRLWYLKCVGPTARMVGVEAGVDALLASFRYESAD